MSYCLFYVCDSVYRERGRKWLYRFLLLAIFYISLMQTFRLILWVRCIKSFIELRVPLQWSSLRPYWNLKLSKLTEWFKLTLRVWKTNETEIVQQVCLMKRWERIQSVTYRYCEEDWKTKTMTFRMQTVSPATCIIPYQWASITRRFFNLQTMAGN